MIGTGSAGARHAQNLLELGVGVVCFDPGPVGTPEGAERVPTLRDALDRVDAAVIASPSAAHAEHAAEALARGLPTLVEKPVATVVEDARGLVAEATRLGVPCGVAMNWRFHPAVLELKRLLGEGRLGRPLFARASFGYDLRRWRPGDYRDSYSAQAALGGGIILDAIHELDYLLWLLGPIRTVAAAAGRLSGLEVDVEDAAVATLVFAQGTLGSVDLNFFEAAYRRECLVVGERATASWSWETQALIVRLEGAADERIPIERDVAPTYRAVVADFLDAVAEGREPRTPITDGLAALEVADAIRRSARERVHVPL